MRRKQMNSEKSKENPTFLIRFYNHLKRYYMIFGIVGLIIAGAISLSLLIGFITFNIIVPIAQMIPPWGYAIIGVVSLPAILALIHTFFETDTACITTETNKKYPKFSVDIDPKLNGTVSVYLWARSDYKSEIIAAERNLNDYQAKITANNMLINAKKIYDDFYNHPHGTYTAPIPINDESDDNNLLIKEINDLKQKVEELSKNKTSSKLNQYRKYGAK
jgi:uncharacterized membrane protein YuzA (DUF378 family)